MKRLCNILCALLLLGTMTSCEDWLDVDPKSEVKSDVMFQSVSGFKDALTGIYLLMSDQDLYGRDVYKRQADLCHGSGLCPGSGKSI